MSVYRLKVGALYVHGWRYFPSSHKLPPPGTHVSEVGLPPQVVLAPSALALLGPCTMAEALSGKCAQALVSEMPVVFHELGAAWYTATPLGAEIEEVKDAKAATATDDPRARPDRARRPGRRTRARSSGDPT